MPSLETQSRINESRLYMCIFVIRLLRFSILVQETNSSQNTTEMPSQNTTEVPSQNTTEVPSHCSGKQDVLSEEAKEELLARMPFEPQLDVFSLEEYAK